MVFDKRIDEQQSDYIRVPFFFLLRYGTLKRTIICTYSHLDTMKIKLTFDICMPDVNQL